MSDPVETFRTEAREHLAALEEALLEMEQQPDNPELIALAFRAMHTIKGAGGMFGFQDLSDFTHHLETALDRVRNGEFTVTPDLITVLLDAGDHIAGMLESPRQTAAQAASGNALLQRLAVIIPEGAAPQTPTAASTTSSGQDEQQGPDTIYRIQLVPSASAFTDGFDVLPVINELMGIGNCVVTTKFDAVPPLDTLDPEQCHLGFDIVLVTHHPRETIEDVFIFVVDEWVIDIEQVELESEDDDDYSTGDQIGHILIERGIVAQKDVEGVLSGRTRTGEALQKAGLVSGQDINAALAEQQVRRETRQKTSAAVSDGIVRVPSARLDTLMNLVGELVIVQARMNQLAHSRDDEDILTISEDLDRLTTELRDNTFSIRMLQIGTTFGRFRRLVRDLSRELGKEIQLETEGAETELDKMMLDRLGDPLVHLIRNSIDHGIESPDEREAAGKARKGTIRLTAGHAESHVVIEILDDGGGLDTERIRDKAIERGLIQRDAQLSDDEINNLIFEAGFSTAQAVTDVSGRGVGMDVVKRSIHELGGSLTLRSKHGQGTHITIHLPMTLAIIEGLMVAVSDERYVLPLSTVEECVELQGGQNGGSDDKRLINIRGELVPYMRLREWFDVPGDNPPIEQIVVTRLGEERFGFTVDEVIGQYQTVIKRLGKVYEGIDGLAGATILGDGGVAMILDAAGLMEALQQETAGV